MKIYNEIIIDMNTGETIYEDSFEYSGDVALCCDPGMGGGGGNDALGEGMFNFEGLPPSDDTSSGGGWLNIDFGDFDTDAWEQDLQQSQINSQTQRSDIQANAAPSLPSISNVGSIAPTGIVNWNAIPGGFQPLPQTAGGRKKLYQLSKFHGGINQKSSPRDIADFECQEAINVTVSQVGRIKLLGDCLNTNAIGADISADSIDENFPGYGLFQFTAPADFDGGTTGEHVFTCVANGDEVGIYESTNGIDADWINGLGTTDDTTVCQVYYAGGNGLYVADANFAHGNASKAKVYVSRDDINATVAVSGWVQGNPLITSPIRAATNASNSVSLETGAVPASTNGGLAVLLLIIFMFHIYLMVVLRLA